MVKTNNINRRNFITKTTLGSTGVAAFLNSCSPSSSNKNEIQLPKLLDQAPDGKILKAGLIGCRNRGTGAAISFIDAGPNLQITAHRDEIMNSDLYLGPKSYSFGPLRVFLKKFHWLELQTIKVNY